MTTQISAIELNPELVNVAYEIGLNIQKTCENALKEAISRLQGLNPENLPVRNAEAAGSNPARSTIMLLFRWRFLCFVFVVAVVGEGWGADAVENEVCFPDVCYALGCFRRDYDCVAFFNFGGFETLNVDFAFSFGD